MSRFYSALVWALMPMLLVLADREARAQSHPPGVDYPLREASIQPAGLPQPLPSTRRYVLVWADQLADAVISITDEQKQWIVTHYVGTQKVFAYQIDEYRALNPGFLMLVYHVAWGLNGSDHEGTPVGNITGPDHWGQEDDDNWQPWWDSHAGDPEDAYMHAASSTFTSDRVEYPDPFWLMDPRTAEWREYLFATLLEWQSYPADGATGVFLDVAFHPWYGYEPAGWWTDLGVGVSHPELAEWWNPIAADYLDAMREAFAATASHPRHLVIPNPDCLQDEEPAFLDATDGAFTENWQCILEGPGTWAVSAGRVLRYVTSAGKVWMVQISSTPSIDERALLMGSYFLLRNGTSYYYLVGEGPITWYPEYEIDLGWYLEEPPEDLESLRVAGTTGGGGLYRRDYSHGLALMNASDGPLSTDVGAGPYRAALLSGGGEVDGTGSMPAYSLEYSGSWSGTVSVPARSSLLLQVESGPPSPGEEPGAPPADPDPDPAPDAPSDAITDAPADTAADLPGDTAADGDPDEGPSSGCGCRLAY